MKDNTDERPEGVDSGEVPVSPDWDWEDHPEVEEDSSRGEETPDQVDPSPQILASLKRQKRSKRSLMFVVLLCLGLGILVLAVFSVMKPEVRKPQIVAKRLKRPIPSGERYSVPAATEEKVGEEKPLEGGPPEAEQPAVSKPSETSIVVEERAGKKVFILDRKEVPEGEKEVKVGEGEGIKPETEGKEVKPEIEGREEEKAVVAKVEKPKERPVPKAKLPAGRFTVNVASFRKRITAERLMKELERKGYKAFVAEAAIPQKGTWYRVSVGRFPSRGEAQAFARTLKEKEGMDSFVRELREKSAKE